MFEKVNPAHPDKLADRIAGAIVDLAYAQEHDPKVAVEVLLGHGHCTIMIESSVDFEKRDIERIVRRIANISDIHIYQTRQDIHLAENQKAGLRCGDNGIFKGVPATSEQKQLSLMAHTLFRKMPYDGKFVRDGGKLVICQSHCRSQVLKAMYPDAIVNPLGDWVGGPDVDAGATNRKLGSDMGDAVTGGGLHGKDLSKADVSVNIYAWIKAHKTGQPVEISCAIGDEIVDGLPYSEIVEIARKFIQDKGGFERFAEWGLV